jgi:perosamine synthetase
MVVTHDDALAARIALLRSHGGIRKEWYFSYEDAGFNYRLSDINAAVGVAQMRKLEWLVTSKRRLAMELKALLKDVPYFTLPVEPAGHLHTYQSFVGVTDECIDRDKLIGLLRAAGVETTLGTYAMHAQPAYTKMFGMQPGEIATSYRLFRQTLTLPLYPQMASSDLVTVAEQLRTCILQAKR